MKKNFKPKNFKEFIEMCGSTGAIYDKTKPTEDWNWVGAPGKVAVTPKKGPIMNRKKGKK